MTKELLVSKLQLVAVGLDERGFRNQGDICREAAALIERLPDEPSGELSQTRAMLTTFTAERKAGASIEAAGKKIGVSKAMAHWFESLRAKPTEKSPVLPDGVELATAHVRTGCAGRGEWCDVHGRPYEQCLAEKSAADPQLKSILQQALAHDSVARQPCPLCGNPNQHSHTAGPWEVS